MVAAKVSKFAYDVAINRAVTNLVSDRDGPAKNIEIINKLVALGVSIDKVRNDIWAKTGTAVKK